ncbi:hypothetical protein LNV23_16660 [Paucibacter sp. DJ1R-11]|uniref:hypothetical protein n=1 Tax=Paucibacter sp. DJ1R-11 TaxID=2893556 RepID=UPI0021E4F325|nr:hypothetical protein [Paucibacter sp. DJ1R-11]MCV2365084.1 hypothetical protein [Paucibacter sp. DJ1R-11]
MLPLRPRAPAPFALIALFSSAMIAGTCSTAARADANPYYIGAALNLSRVSNIYRQNSNANNDTVSTASLLAGLDQSFGRQRLFADASLQANRYQSNSGLNNRGYTLKAGLDWSTVERLSGSLSVNNSRSLANYNIGSGVQPIFKKNIEDNKQLDFITRLGLATKISMEAQGGLRSRRFTAQEYARLEFDQKRVALGLYYRPSSDLSVGLAGRLTRDEYPRYTLVNPITGNYTASIFERKDLDLTSRVVLSGASTVEGRLSNGRSKLKSGQGRDFSGITGQVSWLWKPTARWNLSSSFSRDTGLETSFFNFAGTSLSSDQNRIITGAQFSANYELSAKLALSAGFSSSKTDRRDEFLNQQSSSHDRDKSFNLGARWAYSRGIQLGCQYSKSTRDSSIAVYVFEADSYGCYGQIILN